MFSWGHKGQLKMDMYCSSPDTEISPISIILGQLHDYNI